MGIGLAIMIILVSAFQALEVLPNSQVQGIWCTALVIKHITLNGKVN